MSLGIIKTFAVQFAANATNVTVDVGRMAWRRVWVQSPTFSTGADLAVQGSLDGTTYRQLTWEHGNTSTSSYNSVIVGTGSTGNFVQIPPGFPFYRFVATATVCDAKSFAMIAY